MTYCVYQGCMQHAVDPGNMCGRHRAEAFKALDRAPSGDLDAYDRVELEVLREIHEGKRDRRAKSLRQAAASASFVVAGSAAALALGAGALGVVFVAGAIGGIYFLFGESS